MKPVLSTVLVAFIAAGNGDKSSTTMPVAPPRTLEELLQRVYHGHYPLNLSAATTQPVGTNQATAGQANPPTADLPALPVTQAPLPAMPVTRAPLPAQLGQPFAATPAAPQQQRFAQASTQPWRVTDNSQSWQPQINQRQYLDPRLDPRVNQLQTFNKMPDARDLHDPRLDSRMGVQRFSDPTMNPSLDTRRQRELDALRFGPRAIRGSPANGQ